MGEQVVIARRFNGPPDSAHGGYACAVAAQFLDWSAEVTLRRPPPLEQPLEVQRGDDGSVSLLEGDALVMQASPANLDLDVPDPVSLAEAEAAAENFAWLGRHPFPTCFGCGPDRAAGDGMREFPGPVAGRDALYANPWIPDAWMAGASGEVDPLFTFAALDCPSGIATIEAGGTKNVYVLGRLTGQVLAPVQAAEPLVVMAWPIGVDGRKRYGAVAIFGDGELRAVGEALWIEVRDPDSFGASATS